MSDQAMVTSLGLLYIRMSCPVVGSRDWSLRSRCEYIHTGFTLCLLSVQCHFLGSEPWKWHEIIHFVHFFQTIVFTLGFLVFRFVSEADAKMFLLVRIIDVNK